MMNWSAASTSSAARPDRGIGMGREQQPSAALVFGARQSSGERSLIVSHRSVEATSVALRSAGKIDSEIAGAPELAAALVAAALLGPVMQLADDLSLDGEGFSSAVHEHAERRELAARGHFDPVVHRGQHVGLLDRPVDGVVVGAEMERRPQLQPQGAVARDQG